MQAVSRRFKANFFILWRTPGSRFWNSCEVGELSAGSLMERLGIEPANASQQLAPLRAKNILINH
jgi:hypothetical protein